MPRGDGLAKNRVPGPGDGAVPRILYGAPALLPVPAPRERAQASLSSGGALRPRLERLHRVAEAWAKPQREPVRVHWTWSLAGLAGLAALRAGTARLATTWATRRGLLPEVPDLDWQKANRVRAAVSLVDTAFATFLVIKYT